jgi:uncharacterized protein
MSRKLQGIVAKTGAQLELTIVTNGTLLEKSVAQALSNVGISSAQITIDALRDDGSRKRGLLDIYDQPSLILVNACAARQYMRVGIRVNVSKENENDVSQILEILRAHDFGTDITLARVHDCRSEVTLPTNNLRIHTIFSDLSKPSQEIPDVQGGCHGLSLARSTYASLERDTYLTGPDGLQFTSQKLRPKGQFCSATANYMFVIDPDGYISRCWHSAGLPSEALGNVSSEEALLENNPIAQLLQNYSPLSYPSCVACKVLPLCMGGCSHARLFMNAKKPSCEAIKQQIEFCVSQVATHIEITAEQYSLLGR